METLRLPMGLYNPKGIQAGQFKPCYGLLVLLFFLFHLGLFFASILSNYICNRLMFFAFVYSAEHKDFTVDFAHPIDNKLATFLQSPASVDSLVIGGSLQLPADGGAATAIGPASVGVSPRVSARHSARKANPSVTSHYADRDSAPPRCVLIDCRSLYIHFLLTRECGVSVVARCPLRLKSIRRFRPLRSSLRLFTPPLNNCSMLPRHRLATR
jgi:hypothetical protein